MKKLKIILIVFLWLQAFPVYGSDEPIGISYAQVVNLIAGYFDMEKTTQLRGMDRWIGKSKDETAVLEIAGMVVNISTATLMAGMPNDRQDIVKRNMNIMMQFLRNIDPTWKEHKVWVSTSFDKCLKTGKTESITRGMKKIEMVFHKELGSFVIMVKHK